MSSPLVGTNMSSYGFGGTLSRVYFIGKDGHINELAWNAPNWGHNDLTAMTGAPGASTAAGLTCLGLGGFNNRVFYVGADSQVHKLAWTGTQWTDESLTPSPTAPCAAASPLACYAPGGNDFRLYYLSNDNHIQEIATNQFGGYNRTDLTASAGAPVAATASIPATAASATCNSLACYGVASDNSNPRVYFLDGHGNVYELAGSGSWTFTNVTASTGAIGAHSKSPLTCFGQGGSDARIYYFGTDNQVHELAWVGSGWNTTDLTSAAGAVPPTVGLALTSYEAAGSGSRIYYVGTDNRVRELAWQGNWVANYPPTLAGASPAAPGTALTCFGLGGTDARVYYISSDDNEMHELAWVGSAWVGSKIS